MFANAKLQKIVFALLIGIATGAVVLAQTPAQSPASAKSAAPGLAQPPSAPRTHYQPDRFAGRAARYYSLLWGVDDLTVKWAEQGEIVRFSYHVLDAAKAKTLNDKELEPSLIDPQAGVRLVVPALEQVGILRQSGTPEAGKVYWMAFSNSGRRVKRGDRVTIQIGEFRAVGLVVD